MVSNPECKFTTSNVILQNLRYLHLQETIYPCFTCRILYHGALSSEARAYSITRHPRLLPRTPPPFVCHPRRPFYRAENAAHVTPVKNIPTMMSRKCHLAGDSPPEGSPRGTVSSTSKGPRLPPMGLGHKGYLVMTIFHDSRVSGSPPSLWRLSCLRSGGVCG